MRVFAGLAIGVAALAVGISPALADDLNVSVVSVTSPVNPGALVTLLVQTEPKAVCRGTVVMTVAGGRTTLEGTGAELLDMARGMTSWQLRQQTADAEGKVTWTWKASPQPAKLTLGIRCTAGDKTGNASTSVNIQ